MAGKNLASLLGRNEASGLSTVKARSDEAPDPTEAEFPWTWREIEPIGQFVRRTIPGTTSRNPHRAQNFVSTHHLSEKRKMIAATCPIASGESAARNWFVNALASHAKRGDNIFFKLSSGAIRNRAAGIVAAAGGRQRVRPQNQCWAIAMDEGSTLTPGPIVEDKATRCK
jgi:hypothetical protein